MQCGDRRRPVLLLEMNEINFEFVLRYGEQRRLPTLNALVARHGLRKTTSENTYEDLEPWIQWVTAHTGQSLAEHKVFRLGDIVNHDIPQIWEQLEDAGLRVGAMSPMNAKNRTRQPAFFVPDPWTPTTIVGSPLIHAVYSAVAQAVNDNAASRITPASALKLAAGLAVYARPVNYLRYLRLALGAVRRPWLRTAFLDLLLSDIFVRLVKKTKPDFASLFINAGAHVQHHYMFSSSAYQGELRNPDWYVAPGHDPVLDIYEAYDAIVSQIELAFPEYRLMLATALHQEPHPKVTYYWRLDDHHRFLTSIGAPFQAVSPRMSRDFVVECGTAERARETEALLNSIFSAEGERLFEVDNRGADLFASLVYAQDITEETVYRQGSGPARKLKPEVNFVAIKNGEHDGVGYFIDTGLTPSPSESSFSLATLPDHIRGALDIVPLKTDRSAAKAMAAE